MSGLRSMSTQEHVLPRSIKQKPMYNGKLPAYAQANGFAHRWSATAMLCLSVSRLLVALLCRYDIAAAIHTYPVTGIVRVVTIVLTMYMALMYRSLIRSLSVISPARLIPSDSVSK